MDGCDLLKRETGAEIGAEGDDDDEEEDVVVEGGEKDGVSGSVLEPGCKRGNERRRLQFEGLTINSHSLSLLL